MLDISLRVLFERPWGDENYMSHSRLTPPRSAGDPLFGFAAKRVKKKKAPLFPLQAKRGDERSDVGVSRPRSTICLRWRTHNVIKLRCKG